MLDKLITSALLLGLVAVSGCALTTDKIDLQHTPQANVSAVNGADKVVVNVQVADQRADKSRVSCKKNSYGMEMAPILSNEEVAVTVKRAMEAELTARGFGFGPQATVEVNADILRFYNNFKLGFFVGDAEAELNLDVTVKSQKGQVLYSRQLATKALEANTPLASGEYAKTALNRALDQSMANLFEDQQFITALLESATK